ncbi:MAG: alpha/beta hydrolase [Actinomycetospora sp.]|nr:alpha/beta hydrolase [Actinomycetospora sp.]
MTTWLLLPGAGGAAWYWHRVVEILAARGDEAIAVDLPADDPSAGIPRYVEVALAALGDRPDPVVVGQSLGGFTAVEIARRIPVERLVLVNAMIPAVGETPGQWWADSGHQQTREAFVRAAGREDAGFDPEYEFLHDVPPEVVAAGAEHQRDQSDAPFTGWALESPGAPGPRARRRRARRPARRPPPRARPARRPGARGAGRALGTVSSGTVTPVSESGIAAVVGHDVEVVSLAQVAERLGVPRTRISQMIKQGQLLGIREGERWSVPAAFLTDDGVVKGLPGTIQVLRDGGYGDAEILRWLFADDESLPGAPIEALRSDRGREVKRRAQAMAF